MSDLAELRKLLAAATPRPWFVGATSVKGESLLQTAPPASFSCRSVQVPTKDAALIVAAVNELPRLLDRIDALEKAQLPKDAREIAAKALHDVRKRNEREGTPISAEQYRDADAVLSALGIAQ